MKQTKTLKIVQAGIFLALLIVFQFTTKSMGQIITGSLVNFCLIGTVLTVGFWGGLAVATISPILASMMGIGPAFVQIVPMIILGNIVIIIVYALILSKAQKLNKDKNLVVWGIAIITGAIAKYITLYFGVVKLVIPTITFPKPEMAAKLAVTFGIPQLITALIGGVIAIAVLPPVIKVINKQK